MSADKDIGSIMVKYSKRGYFENVGKPALKQYFKHQPARDQSQI
jgi:hypothetical protein